MTVTRVHSASTSSSLWETKATIIPLAARARSVAKSRSCCTAEMPVVGSSRISTRAPSQSSRVISNCWRSPTVSERTGAAGSKWKPNSAEMRSSSRAAAARRTRRPLPSRKLSSTVKGRKTSGSWCSMPMPGPDGGPGGAERHRPAVEDHLAGVGRR